jgi:hypothetical protein
LYIFWLSPYKRCENPPLNLWNHMWFLKIQ